MRNLIIAVVALSAASLFGATVEPAQARDYRFCVKGDHNVNEVYGDCSYDTLAQCKASASGRRAYCDVNPLFSNARERRRH